MGGLNEERLPPPFEKLGGRVGPNNTTEDNREIGRDWQRLKDHE